MRLAKIILWVCFSCATLIAIFFIFVLIINHMPTYTTESFTSETENKLSTYLNENYYYIDKNKSDGYSIYRFDNNAPEEIAKFKDNIKKICEDNTYLYTFSDTNIIKINPQDKSLIYFPKGYIIDDISSDKENIVAFIRTEYSNEKYFALLKDNDIHKLPISPLPEMNDRTAFYTVPVGEYTCIFDKDKRPACYSNLFTKDNKRLLAFDWEALFPSGDNMFLADSNCFNLRTILKKYTDGKYVGDIMLPVNFFYTNNAYLEDDQLILLGRNENPKAILFDMCNSSLRESQYAQLNDMILSVGFNGDIKTIFETTTKKERIVGYDGKFVYLFKSKNIYAVDIDTGERELLHQVNKWFKDYNFEICHDKIFVWGRKLKDDFKFIGAYNLKKSL